ncbi:hypothetical protein QZH41_008860 [Actinostola sp. cb2023]|nr:hypothetical protein QZH41_008860 [Actinostola sp. cb2023]
MSRKVLLLVQLLVMLDLLSNTSAIQTNAYSNNIDTCLFQSWQSGSEAVLSGPVNCGDKVKQFQLCYNKAGQNPAQYAVCYNNETLIPDFTGHVVVTNIQGAGRKCSWHDEGGTQYAPSPESSVNDYKCTLQDGLYQNKDINAQQFCSRGHYTPNADFSDCEERQMTFINTNIAPQWQLFNAENWAALEAAVRNYANSVQRSVYVFTGTGNNGALTKDDDEKHSFLSAFMLIIDLMFQTIDTKSVLSAPKPQASSTGDYSAGQRNLYPNYDSSRFFLNRGHLTPNADFAGEDQRELTMISTNIAPQWTIFNSGNWEILEKAVRAYASHMDRAVYVFTGTGGRAKNIGTHEDIKLNNRIRVPRYFWKAVCDPVAKASVLFLGENSVGVTNDNDKVQGCNGRVQLKKRGVIYCYSLEGAVRHHKTLDWKLPPFHQNCKPSEKGYFMDLFLNDLK